MAEDAADVGEEAHVEHLVGFVEDQGLHPRQVDGPLAEVIEQPPRTGDDDLGAPLELLHLRVDTDPAVDGDAAQAGAGAEGDECGVDLFGQFAGRSDDQGAHIAAPTLHQPMQNRQAESGGLAGPGLGQAQNVAAGEDAGDRCGLDRRRCGEPGGGNARRDLGMKLETAEIHGALSSLRKLRKP